MMTGQRKKKCGYCKKSYEPWNTLQKACSPRCALELSREQKAKQERKKLRQRKRDVKTLPELAKELQVLFNKYIRLRDFELRCISCQRHHSGQYHAGHFRHTKANPELRFNVWNVHKQCSSCNNHLSGNLVNYRINLIKKIGIEKVEWLEGPHHSKNYTREDYARARKILNKKIKKLNKKVDMLNLRV